MPRLLFRQAAMRAAASLLSLTALLAPVGSARAKAPSQLVIKVLDVGNGNCIVVDCPTNDGDVQQALVVDCGTTSQSVALSDPELGAQLNLIAGTGYQRRVVLTHPDIDHVNRVGKIPSPVKTAWLGGRLAGYDKQAGVKAWLKDHVQEKKLDFAEGEAILPGPQCGLALTRVLAVNSGWSIPDEKASQATNENSLVLRIEYGAFSAVLPGDVGPRGFAFVGLNANELADLQTTVLVTSHHGSMTNGEGGLLARETFEPRAVIYSAAWTEADKAGLTACNGVQQLENNLLATGLHQGRCTDKVNGFAKSHDVPTQLMDYFTATNGSVIVTVDAQGGVDIQCADYRSPPRSPPGPKSCPAAQFQAH